MDAARPVFLTGATGFIGSRLSAKLAARGYRLRCLVRSPARATALKSLGAELIEGDVTDETALARGMRGASAALHLAAIYDIGVVNARELQRVNVDGTRAFLKVAARSGIERAIYVSTTVALGPVSAGVGDEATRNHGPFRSAYEETKTVAHGIALESQQDGLSLIIVCPAYVYGPGDNGPGGRFLFDLMHHRVPGLLVRPASFNYVHVDDVVDGLVAVLERGRIGETYILGGEAATVNEFAKRAARIAGVRAPILRFPAVLARETGRMLDMLTRMTGVRFPITRENVNTVAGHRWLHSSMKAEQELGWRARSLDEGLPETIASLRK